MPQKSYCQQIVGILIRPAYPEIISVHSKPAKNFEFQMKFVSMGLDIIQLIAL